MTIAQTKYTNTNYCFIFAQYYHATAVKSTFSCQKSRRIVKRLHVIEMCLNGARQNANPKKNARVGKAFSRNLVSADYTIIMPSVSY